MTGRPPWWASRSVLVTGSTGFLGTWLVQRLLKEGASVVGLCREPSRGLGHFTNAPNAERLHLIESGIYDCGKLASLLRDYSIDTVFHLAAESNADRAREAPREVYEVNVRGTWSVLEAISISGIKVHSVLASTDMVYGDQDNLPFTEDSPRRGTSPYAVSKICAEEIAQSYCRTFGVPVTIARCCNLYGGGDFSFQRIVPGSIRAVLRGEAPVIRSDGDPQRDYLYVEDAVTAFLQVADAMHERGLTGEAFNFSTAEPYSVRQVVQAILALMGCPDLQPRVVAAAASEAKVRHSSSAKAERVLGWKPVTDLKTGLRSTIAWYRANAGELQGEAQN